MMPCHSLARVSWYNEAVINNINASCSRKEYLFIHTKYQKLCMVLCINSYIFMRQIARPDGVPVVPQPNFQLD